ncbi:hypothetical protein M2451_000683 [Dysgonomonas sp. PFB1-18]|nr:hypothetical protein [Dysgonomonas sp. PF1-14]MDH6337452.1 hypothetical protein [Dysgonomonas sp. PF1-16]MDH6379376.1 hypothetical protein [Dysgonomonas sp. PFB1-18]MDH6395986.1 hypothetical protein [Dysgonomonas sp. PF1-23]
MKKPNIMKKKHLILLFILPLLLISCGEAGKTSVMDEGVLVKNKWSIEKANEWYARQGWIVGCNYSPSTAVNQLEMWQKETYDAATIDKELGWAQALGFNTMRVYLHSLVWESDPEGFKQRINDYLTISSKHGIKTILVFFDDCWNPEATIGKQPEPKTGVHNSGWVHDPIVSQRADTVALYPKLKAYVTDILRTFGNDERVLMWDLYNEPGNVGQLTKSLPLLKKVFEWAREVNPSQPLTVGVWRLDFYELNKFQNENSDIISYHCYHNAERHQDWIHIMKSYGRPIVCTEWMGRRFESTFEKVMPMLKEQQVGAISWGFVAGKTNTIFAWDDPRPDGKEPTLWFHDILRTDGTPYSKDEISTIKKLTGVGP